MILEWKDRLLLADGLVAFEVSQERYNPTYGDDEENAEAKRKALARGKEAHNLCIKILSAETIELRGPLISEGEK